MLRIRPTIGMLIAPVLLAVLAACSASAQSADLDGTEWVLTSLNGRSLIPSTHIMLHLDQGKAMGFSGCNAYGGSYAASNRTLKIAEFAMTVMACLGPEGVMQQEDGYAAKCWCTPRWQNESSNDVQDRRPMCLHHLIRGRSTRYD